MLGQRLKYLRKLHKKNQQDIADLLGITRPAYTAYENENRTPDNNSIKKLADYYDVSIDYLFGRTDIPSSPQQNKQSKDERDIAKRLKSFKEDIKNGDGLAFDGEPMSDEALESFIESIEHIYRQTQRINKKYTPKKFRDDE